MIEATGRDEAPPVSAVVINFNGGERTIRCLDALTRRSEPLERVIVVDNGSEDGSPEHIRKRFPNVDVIELGQNRGPSVARNVGLAAAPSDLVLLADSDIYLEPDALRRLVSARDATGATVVCPRIRLLPDREVVQADGAAPHFIGTMTLVHAYRRVDELAAERTWVRGCIGACYLLDRTRVIEAGGFNETYFFYFEDLEFMLRLAAYGHDFVCEPAALVFHDRREGTSGLSFRGTGAYPRQRAYLSMRHRWLTILIHYRFRTLLILLPALTLYELAVIGFAMSQGWGLQWLKAWSWQIRNLTATARSRRVVQRSRVRKDRDILVGGPLPLAPGVIRKGTTAVAVSALSAALNTYWRVARHLIG